MLIKGTKEEIESLKIIATNYILNDSNYKEGLLVVEDCCLGAALKSDGYNSIEIGCDQCILNCSEVMKHLDDDNLCKINPFKEKFVTFEHLE